MLAHRGYLQLECGDGTRRRDEPDDEPNLLPARPAPRGQTGGKADGHRLFRSIVHHTRKHGIWLVLLSRFVFGFRMAIPMTVGALGMSMTRFVISDVCGAIIWAGLTQAPPDMPPGTPVAAAKQSARHHEWAVAAVLIVLTLAWGVYRRRHVQEVTTLLDRTDLLAWRRSVHF